MSNETNSNATNSVNMNIKKYQITDEMWNSSSVGRNDNLYHTTRDTSFGGRDPFNDSAHNANDNGDMEHKTVQQYVNLNNAYRDDMMHLSLVDASTGKHIEDDIYSISDSVRLARGGDNIQEDWSVIYHNYIPRDPLGYLKVTNDYHYNVRSSVEALGLYISTLIKYQVTRLGDRNSDLGQVEDKTVASDITFRNYIAGGSAPRNPLDGSLGEKLYEYLDDEDQSKVVMTESLGIGLGHCMVLNPVFQFNKRDDVRTNPMYTRIGRVYSTQIMNNWPVVLFQPGRLKYNTGFFKMLGLGGGAGPADTYIRSGGEGIFAKISEFFMNVRDAINVVGTVGSAIFGGHKLIEFRDCANMFKMYSRSLYMLMSQIMGLWSEDKNGKLIYNGSVKYLDTTHILPTMHMSGGLSKFITNQYIPFRCQKGCTGSETFSNNTETNPLMEDLNATAAANSEEGMNNNGLGSWLKNKGMKILGNFSDKAAVLSGQGRITLPDVWTSSSFSRSINLDFEFHYPYGDTLGKFENTLLQFLTILTMGLARQTGKMTYTSPFLLRVYIKNHIFINYGMIESITVTRGGDSNDWCEDGYPKTLKVGVSIKDMEPNISLPLASRGPFKMALEVMFPTSGMSEYLSSIGGISMDEMTHPFRKNTLTRAKNIFRSTWSAKLNWDNIQATVANTRIISNVLQMFHTSEIEILNKLGDITGIYREKAAESMFRNTFITGVPVPGQAAYVFDNSPGGKGKSYLSTYEAEEVATAENLGKIEEQCSPNWGVS